MPVAESDHDLLLRIDERVRQAMTTMEQRDIYHRGEMDRLSSLFRETVSAFTTTIGSMQTNFVTRQEMKGQHDMLRSSVGRLERVVYGACGLILIAVIGGLMTLILKGQHP